MNGNLIIKPLTANLTRNTDFLSRMDPYVKFILGGQVKQTNVAYEAGKTPGWNDQISFYYNNEDMLTIEVWDKDKLSKDDMVGSASLAMATIQKRGNMFNDWIQLTYKGKDAGRILLDIRFDQSGGMGYGGKIKDKNKMGMGMGMMQPGPMQNTFPVTTCPQTQGQMGYQQQQVYPQQMQHQQVIPQQGMTQQVYPQQQHFPQQQTFPQQQIYQQGMQQTPCVDQYGRVQQQGQQMPGQFIPQNNMGQQGMYQQPGMMNQQGYHNKPGFY